MKQKSPPILATCDTLLLESTPRRARTLSFSHTHKRAEREDSNNQTNNICIIIISSYFVLFV
jgi:hypothetical protein